MLFKKNYLKDFKLFMQCGELGRTKGEIRNLQGSVDNLGDYLFVIREKQKVSRFRLVKIF